MIFVTGPLFAGKREYICKALGWSEEDLARRGIWEVQNLAGQEEDWRNWQKNLAQYEVVTPRRSGGGVVPWTRCSDRTERPQGLGLPLGPAGDRVILFSVVCLRR
ncbi:MAG: cobinamide kinase [Evtepia gabavorous]